MKKSELKKKLRDAIELAIHTREALEISVKAQSTMMEFCETHHRAASPPVDPESLCEARKLIDAARHCVNFFPGESESELATQRRWSKRANKWLAANKETESPNPMLETRGKVPDDVDYVPCQSYVKDAEKGFLGTTKEYWDGIHG